MSPTPRPPPAVTRPKNRLLASLPEADFQRIQPDLNTVALRPKQVLCKQGDRLKYVWVPNGGVVSVTTNLSDGSTVEAATVGDEGMLGIEAFFSGDVIAPGETLLQVPDTNLERMTVEAFRREVNRHGALHDAVGHYVRMFIAQMMQATACNALHTVEQRCARWLLMTHDRMHERDFHLSHEFLAVMLGVQRPTVTEVAGLLQHAGLIHYSHGHVTVIDRRGLERSACECYRIIRGHFDRLPS